MGDSFEKIIEDAQLSPCTYTRKRGAGPFSNSSCRGCMFAGPVSFSCDEKMRGDLVRRCLDAAAAWYVETVL